MNILLTETEGNHIAIIMGITEASLLSSLDNIIYAVESHIDKKIDETNLTEDELEDCINQHWGLDREYKFYHHLDDDESIEIVVNLKTENVLY